MSKTPIATAGHDAGDHGRLQEDLPPWEAGPIDIGHWFGFDRPELPLEIEIGSGKGTFLVQQAPLRPDVNYLGIEWARAYWRHAADRARRHGLGNVRLLRAEAGLFLRHYVADTTLEQLHIYFPDPWPKARHHKRRLIQAPFLRDVHRALVPGGRIRLATDHADYFAWMEEHVAAVADLFDRQAFESPESASEGELVGSNFERKYRREGRPFHGMILVKR